MDILRRRSFVISVIAFLAVTFLLSYLFVDSDIFGRRAPFFTSEQTTKKFIPEDLRLGVLKAESLFNAGKREDAISVLRTLGGRYPDEADVHYVLATFLLVDATYTRGREYKDVKLVHTNVDEGLSHLRRAADLAPKKKEYLYSYAIGLADFGRNEEAIKEFEKVFADASVRSDPKYRLLILNFADALAATGQRERALDEYRKSLDVAPDDTEIMRAYQALSKLKN